MIWVCLLRGINVGGNHKVDMKRLKDVFSEKGYHNIKTYINSGNVLFESSDTQDTLTTEITQCVKDVFDVDTQVLILDKQTFIAIAQAIPDAFVNDSTYKADVVFYLEGFNPYVFSFKEGIDQVVYHKSALIHCVLREHQTRSGLKKIIGTPSFKKITIRNVNTVRKLCEMLLQTDSL
ncbi:hypothetical protein AOC36_02385 [Erysipelothrix larvae]|uniref:DUF1697 domain-containing protein n=2 Tax=Erysipelothrix larvae TaxID=1514105 RepID=A0A0X8GYQ2_9FIRM|nr:DUF1697 domain-containing protein [Erysipelothrix larvae]AMC92871.1 hypothetical protein AOC36_02385 [Erysipelothrix larvae]